MARSKVLCHKVAVAIYRWLYKLLRLEWTLAFTYVLVFSNQYFNNRIHVRAGQDQVHYLKASLLVTKSPLLKIVKCGVARNLTGDKNGNRCISRISDSSKHHFHIPRRQFKEKFDESARQITRKFCVHSSNGMWAYSSKIRLQHIARISLQIHRKIVTFLPVPHEYFEDNGHEYFWNNISNSFSSVLNCTFLFKYSSPLSPN